MILELALFSSLALPQAPTSGLFMEVPVTLVDSPAASNNEILYAGAGYSQAVNAWGFSARMALQSMFGATLANKIKFNSISRGTSWVTVTEDVTNNKALAKLGGDGWSFILYSVTNNTTGLGDPGNLYQQESNLGGAIYSYILEDTSALPAHYVNIVEKVRDANEMGVSSVEGIDSYAVAGLGQQPILPIVDWFFTVERNACADIPTSGASPWCAPGQALPDTIFRMRFVNNAWQTPYVFLLGSQIFTDPPLPGIGIDALTIDSSRGRILLSTDECDVERELYYVRFTGGGQTAASVSVGMPYWNKDGTDYFAHSYLGIDSQGNTSGPNTGAGVNGICIDDPVQALAEYGPLGGTSNPMWRNMFRGWITAFPIKGHAPTLFDPTAYHRVADRINDKYYCYVRSKYDSRGAGLFELRLGDRAPGMYWKTYQHNPDGRQVIIENVPPLIGPLPLFTRWVETGQTPKNAEVRRFFMF